MKLAPLFVASLISWHCAQGEGFESYSAGQDASAIPGWSAPSPIQPLEGRAFALPKISEEQSASGSKSLEIPAGTNVTYNQPPSSGVQFYDISILPVFGEESEAISVGGARIGFAREGDGGRVVVFSGDGGSVRPLPIGPFAITPDGSSETWIRITVRVDHKKTSDLGSRAAKCDVYVNGIPAAANLPVGSESAALEVHGPGQGSTFIDDFVQSPENPLFADGDQDGMPDAEEKANGLNAFGDDRDGDLDGDSISNIEEMFAGTSPQAPVSQNPPSILYVDNLAGSDTNTGSRSYVAIGADGPKASIKAAMAAAPGGSTIVVLKGKGSYEEGSRGVEGKPLTIKTVDPVTIK